MYDLKCRSFDFWEAGKPSQLKMHRCCPNTRYERRQPHSRASKGYHCFLTGLEIARRLWLDAWRASLPGVHRIRQRSGKVAPERRQEGVVVVRLTVVAIVDRQREVGSAVGGRQQPVGLPRVPQPHTLRACVGCSG